MRRIEIVKKEFEQKLEQEFPFMRREEVTDEQWEKGNYTRYNAYGCEGIIEGWYSVIRGLCAEITEAFEKRSMKPEIEIHLVKEKFGILRFYWSMPDKRPDLIIDFLGSGQSLNIASEKDDISQEIREIVRKWEEKSGTVCYTCGEAGELRKDLSWISTMCDTCYKDLLEVKEALRKRKEEPESYNEKMKTELPEISKKADTTRHLRLRQEDIDNIGDQEEYVILKQIEDIDWGIFADTALKNILVEPENRYFTSVNGALFSKYMTEFYAYPPKKEDASFDVPDDVRKIWHDAFKNARNLVQISIPDSVGFIGNGAFEGCLSLVGIDLPKAWFNERKRVFYNCPSLEYINVTTEYKTFFYGNHYNSTDGVLFKGPIEYTRYINREEKEERTEHTLMRYPEAKTGESYVIPHGITHILEYAFSGQRYLKSITLPSTVTDIGEGAFEGCREDLQLICCEGSYAHSFALEHKFSHSITD